MPITKVPNILVPAEGDLSFENYLVEVMDHSESFEFNFAFKNGEASKLKASVQL
jgi:hypothetical protein